MNFVRGITATLATFSLILVLLLTSVEVACYSDFDFYKKEYEKYQVTEELEMELDDVMHVTEEMMSYLKGDREDLVVDTKVSGEAREFFNDREKAHMEDVKELFAAGFRYRRMLLAVCVLSICFYVYYKGNWKLGLARAYQLGLILFTMISGVVAILFATNFTKYFVKFHEMFFDNDLWFLDPETDLLIRMLPEGIFADMAMRIGIIFALFLGVTFIFSMIWPKLFKDKKGLSIN